MSTGSDDQPTSEVSVIIALLAEARAMIASLQEQVTQMRQQTFDTTRNLDMRLRTQETLHGALLYILAGAGVLAMVVAAVALTMLAVAAFQLIPLLRG